MKKFEVNQNLYLDCSSIKEDVVFDVISNVNVTITLVNFEDITSIHFEVADNSTVQLSMFGQKPLNSGKITANIGQNSKIVTYYADFSKDKTNLEASINLNKENASCEWHLASLSDKKDQKEITVNIYHVAPFTYGRIDNYGVSKDNSKLLFAGVSHIQNGCHKSAAHQNAKIVVFDNDCKAIAKPILRIDENDIEASHAAAVGKISDEHLFYLTSRGLTKDEAKMLITLGYLKPILKGFDASLQEEISKNIEGRL